MTDNMAAIQVVRLSKAFDNQVVLQEISCQVAQGESVALTGSNGAGKTTLLRCLAAAVRPDRGEVRWFGQAAGARPAARRLVGMAAHESQLYARLTLRENLIFAARMCGTAHPAGRADELLDGAGLARHANRLPRQVSQGMRGRATIVRALVHDPKIVLLDEPFSGLDTQGADWLGRLLGQLRDRGRTICFATHDEQKYRSLADRVLFLQSGRLREGASPVHEVVDTPPPGHRAA